MKQLKNLFLLSFTILTASCSMNQAHVNYDQNTDIDVAHYQTFAWATDSKITVSSNDINPVMKVRVDHAIEQAFIAKGYQLINKTKKPDFTISYTVGSRTKLNVDTRPASYQFGIGRGRFSARSYYGTESSVREYTEGKLAIDIFDVKSQQPVFHGWATQRITSEMTESDLPAINNIILQTIEQFK